MRTKSILPILLSLLSLAALASVPTHAAPGKGPTATKYTWITRKRRRLPPRNGAGRKHPSGTHYTQNGNPLRSLGAHEHWNNDRERQYTRNLDPKNGKGIELLYIRTDKTPQENADMKAPRRNTTQGDPRALLPQYKVEQTPPSWVVATAESVMARYPDYRTAYWKPWNYVTGYMLAGVEMLYKKTATHATSPTSKNTSTPSLTPTATTPETTPPPTSTTS